MHFHRTWHDHRDIPTPRLFELGEFDRTLGESLTTVAQLKSVPKAQTRQALVAELRDRLTAEALEAAAYEIEESTRAAAHRPHLQQVRQYEG
jgi:hypothetical protein